MATKAAPSGRNNMAFRMPSATDPSPHSRQRIAGVSSLGSNGVSVATRITRSHRMRNPRCTLMLE